MDLIIVKGIVIKTAPVGESDRRITLLTNSRGKIGAFARGARKPGSRFGAATCQFAFGTFKLYEGRDSYNLGEAEIENYFEELRSDMEAMMYASYFAEIADYYCRENSDELEMMKLLYQSLRAILSPAYDRRLVRGIYELKSLEINGEYPGVPEKEPVPDAVRMALEHIGRSSVEKLYTFALSENALPRFLEIATAYRSRYMDRNFKSLELLDALQ